jgi:hypothetical protein
LPVLVPSEGQRDQLFQTAVDLALGGNVACLKMALDRIEPARKGCPIAIDMPAINSFRDVPAASIAILNAIREGSVTPDEAAALTSVVDRLLNAIETHDLTKRIEALEEARDEWNEKKSASSD